MKIKIMTAIGCLGLLPVIHGYAESPKDPSSSPGTKADSAAANGLLVGKWLSAEEPGGYLLLNADGTGIEKSGSSTYNRLWRADSRTLFIKSAGNPDANEAAMTYSIKEGAMTCSISGISLHYVKEK